MSPSGEKILGYLIADLGDIHRSDIIHPDDITSVKILFKEVVRTPASLKKIEYRIKTGEGNLIWIACTYYNLLEEPGIQGIVLNFRDTTEQKEADQALQISEEQYRFLFHLNPQPMWIYDAETLRFLEVNEAAVQHYGYSVEEFYKMTIRDIQLTQDSAGLPQDPEQTGKERSFSNVLSEHRKSGGILFLLRSNLMNYTITAVWPASCWRMILPRKYRQKENWRAKDICCGH